MSRAQQYPRLVLALVCLPVFIGALDLTIVSAVLPDVIRSLTIEIQKFDIAGWVVTGYFVSYAISMTFMGKVSDLAGRRAVYLLCLAIFFLGSWLVAVSPGWPASLALRVMALVHDQSGAGFASLYALIAGRVVQAFGAGAMVPVSMALVADLFPPEKRALPLGVVGAVDTAGWVLGHLYGGIMVQFMSWPYLFWINLPVVFVIFCITWWGLAGLPRVSVKGGIDWIGVTLLGAALVLLNLGLGSPEISGTDEATMSSPHTLYWVAGAAVAFAFFLFWQRRARYPILDLRMFSIRNVSAASAVNLLVGFCIMVALVSVPIFINVAGGADTMKAALVTGYLLCAFTIPMALAAIPGGWLSERLGYRTSVIVGLVVSLGGFLMMSRWRRRLSRFSITCGRRPRRRMRAARSLWRQAWRWRGSVSA
jgi:MFS family permease